MYAITKLYEQSDPTAFLTGNDSVARYFSDCLLSEIEQTILNKDFLPAPFVQYERHFSKSEFHIENFRRLIAQKGLLIPLLAANWFKSLTQEDWQYISPLFLRILNTEGVQRSINRRPQFLKNTCYISEHASCGNMPADTTHVKKTEASSTAPNKDDPERRAVEIKPVAAAARPARYSEFELSDHVASIVARVSDFVGAAPDPGFDKILLAAIRTALTDSSYPADLAKLLSAFEICFGEDEAALFSLVQLQDKSGGNYVTDTAWIDTIAFSDRVLVSSLLRRIALLDGDISKRINSPEVTERITVGNQSDVAQFVNPDVTEQEETNDFQKILTGEVARSDRIIAAPGHALGDALSSEASLKLSGWYKIVGGADWKLSEAIRTRAYGEVIATAHNASGLAALSPTFRMYAASVSALLGRPVLKNVAEKFPSIAPDVTCESRLRAAAIKENAHNVLFRRELSVPQESPRAMWLALQDCALGNDMENFANVMQRLGERYAEISLRALTARSVSFDVFLITNLPRILTAVLRSGMLTSLPVQAVIALAYCAISTQQISVLSKLFEVLDQHEDMTRSLYVPILLAYRMTGIHGIDALLSNTNHQDVQINPTLIKFDSQERVLALIEGTASMRSLGNVTAEPAMLECVPLQPAQVTDAPDFAKIVQVDDVIPTYGADDAKLSAGLDHLVTACVAGTKNILKTAGFDDLLINTVDASHPNVFSPAYRDLVCAHIAQQYVDKADSYDRVILVLHNGLSYGPLIKELIAKVGKDRLHITIQNERLNVSMSALNEIRRNFDLPPVGRERPFETDWVPNLKKWRQDAYTAYRSMPMRSSDAPYAIACLEQINGYGDSYKALVSENLKRSDVEVLISVGNSQMQAFIDNGGFEDPDGARGQLRQFSIKARPDTAVSWLPGLQKHLEHVLDEVDSPLFPKWKHMFALNLAAYMGQRLPRIFDALAYMTCRFDKQLPTHVMTAPNQFTTSRVAGYVAQSRGVPVYDFLILANTDHPRYRPPVADIVYLYDDWYKEIYTDFFKMNPDKLRQSGPLFRYSDRLKSDMTGYEKTAGQRDVVLFSQSANFEATRLMLDAVCSAVADRDDISLTVKLHPHESPGNLHRFLKIAQDCGVKDRLSVIHKGDAVALVNKADVVVQSFSNIGLDAFLLGKSVITYKPPTALTSRIYLYEKEIGEEVKDAASLAAAVTRLLDSPQARDDMAAKAQKFARDNAHFLDDNNASRVIGEIYRDLAASGASVKA